MADLLGVLGHEELTGVVQQFVYPELQLANRVPGRDIDGDVCRWTVEKPDPEVHPYFVGRSGQAMPLKMADYGEKTFGIPYRFTSKTLDGGVLAQLDAPGTRDYDAGQSVVDSELRGMNWKVGPYTDEFLISQALQGSLTIKIGNAAVSSNLTLDFEIPAGNKISSAANWSAAGTNILSDVRAAKDTLAKYGLTAKYYILNDVTANYIHTNTTLQNYFKEYNVGRQLTETGNLPPLLGVQPMVVSTRYADVGVTDRFESKFIADNKVIFVPDFPAAPGDWIEWQRGTMYVPNDMQNGLDLVRGGVGSWSRTSDNPPGLTMYLRVLRFPVVRKPWAVVIMTTG